MRPAITITTPLEDIRAQLGLTRAAFAERLGVTEETYTRLLARDASLGAEMLQGVAAKLGVAPHLVAECVPRPTPARIAELAAIIAETDAAGAWLRIEDDGTLTPDPQARAIRQG